jgi:hypothetical protein
LLQRPLGDDAAAAIGEDGDDDHLAAVGIVVTELHIGSAALAVVLRVDEADRHPNPHDENPGRGDADRGSLGREDRSKILSNLAAVDDGYVTGRMNQRGDAAV